jgi:DNA-binding NarL/FixJ family response regulator
LEIKVAVVDEHQLFREGLRFILEAQPDLRVVVEAAQPREAYSSIDEIDPDVVLLKLSTHVQGGLEAVRELRRREPSRRVLVLASERDEGDVARALSAGAAGYFLEDQSAADLTTAVRGVARGERYLPPQFSEAVVAQSMSARRRRLGVERSEQPLGILSDREREIFELIVSGSSNSDVAAHLCISVATVETHRSHIFRKLNVHSLAELIRWAARHNLLKS